MSLFRNKADTYYICIYITYIYIIRPTIILHITLNLEVFDILHVFPLHISSLLICVNISIA